MTMTFSELLSLVEFNYCINNNGTLSLVDNLSVNLNHIEEEKYSITPNIASVIIDRLDIYIEDYILADIREQYSVFGYGEIDCDANLEEYLNAIKQYPNDFNYKIKILDHLNNPSLIDIEEFNNIDIVIED